MKVNEYIKNKLSQGAVHITLIDPSRQLPEAAGRLAQTAQEVGSDLVLIGASAPTSQRTLMETVEAIKEKTTIPVIFLPSGAEAISFNLDAMFFLSMLNSRNAGFIAASHAGIALVLKKLGVETIPVGYILVEPGMKSARSVKPSWSPATTSGKPSAMPLPPSSWAWNTFTLRRVTARPSPFLPA